MRLVSLDVFRGLTIAAMILVNFNSLSPRSYSVLEHSLWNGCNIADLVFPFFLFIMGAAFPLSFAKYLSEQKNISPAIIFKIIRRFLILFGLGIFLNGFYQYDWAHIRILGVLQRISLTYFVASFFILKFSRKQLRIICLLILIGYYLALNFLPVPDYGIGKLTPTGNLGAYFDRLVITKAHLYKGGDYHFLGDPEGLFSTLPSLVTVLIGFLASQWLILQKSSSKTSVRLVLFGFGCVILGLLFSIIFPINKQLWTSSYVLYTAGWALLVLSACYEVIEVRKAYKLGKIWEIIGLNPIFIFIASVLEIKILTKTQIGSVSSYQWYYEHFFLTWLSPENASMLMSILTVFFWWLVAYILYRQRWLIKI